MTDPCRTCVPVSPWAVVLLALAASCAGPSTPELQILPTAPTTTDTLQVQWDGSDPDARIAWYRDGVLLTALLQATEVPSTRTAKGQRWQVVVTPGDGADSSVADVTIQNAAPEATLTISPSPPTTLDYARARVETDDPDGEPTTERLIWSRDGSETDHDGPLLPPDLLHKGDTWAVRLEATDPDGATGTATASFTVANLPPTVDAARLSPDTFDRRDMVSCFGEGWSDADDDPPGYKVAWRVDGEAFSSASELPIAGLPRGTSVGCRLTAFDGEDEGNTVASRLIRVSNTPPSIESLSISPGAPTRQDTLTAEVRGASDVDGDAFELAHRWRVNGRVAGHEPTLDGSAVRRGDRVRLMITATDAQGATRGFASNLVRGANNPPEVLEITLDPARPRTDDVVRADLLVFDHDGDEITSTYEWLVNGRAVGVTDPELDGRAQFDKGDGLSVRVTPFDGVTHGVAVTSPEFVVLNSPPTRPEVALDPAEPDGTTDVQCRVTTPSTDADPGDAIDRTFEWLVNGDIVTDTTTTTHVGDTLPAAAYDSGDAIICRLRVSDGEDSAPTASAGTVYGVEERPGIDCDDILDELGTTAETGDYWIDPDDDGDPSDALHVVCDMDSDGGGWTLTYYNDAEHFDGFYVNNTTRSASSPAALNDQRDLWSIPAELDHTETLLGCTTDDEDVHWWRFASTDPYDAWNSTTASTTTYRTLGSRAMSSGTKTGDVFTDLPGSSSSSSGFAALNHRAGGCAPIQWGMNHYANSVSGYGSNCTDTSEGAHRSPYRSRDIYWPICAEERTTTGTFWIGVR